MMRSVKKKLVEAVECPLKGLIPIELCMKCVYFGGYRGFKLIECRR